MALNALLVADPVGDVADLVVSQCRRLSEVRLRATTGEAALAEAERARPQLLVLAVELAHPGLEQLLPTLTRLLPDSLVVATFRELTVPQMERLGRLGVDEFVAQPVRIAEIFRAVAQRFALPFRQHPRFDVGLDVRSAAGTLLGRTLNLSEGGMRVALKQPLQVDDSVLVDLALPDGEPRPWRARWRLLAVDGRGDEVRLARGVFDNLRGGEHRRLLAYLGLLDGGGEAIRG